MNSKKVLTGICTMALAVSMLTGCGGSSNKEDSTQVVQVTSVDGNKVTAQVGTLKERSGGERDGQKPEGTPPAKPEGENGELPQDGDKGGMPGGSPFEAGDSTVSFQLTDSTKITVEQFQEQTDGSTEDIVEGAVLEITLDEDNNATKVVVKSFKRGDKSGESDNGE